MADYDCSLHAPTALCTRYSELIRCTPGQIDRVLYEREHPESRAITEDMTFGTLRHEMLAEAGRVNGVVPYAFGVRAALDYIEDEFATEVLRDVVVHSRPDAVSVAQATIFDYKTIVDRKQGWRSIVNSYKHEAKQRQLKFYAFQLGLHGIRIKHGAFLCEIWNEQRDKIIGCEVVEFPISLGNIAPVLSWVKGRVAVLSAELTCA